MNNYSDIINLQHHTSTRHKRMSIEARATQFAPFAALNGYGEAVAETARLTNSKIELSEEMKQIINEKLNIINNHIKELPQVTITYFIKDLKKKGGSYTTITANIKQIEPIYNTIILTNKKKINIEDIINIS